MPEPLLLAEVISIKFSCASPNMVVCPNQMGQDTIKPVFRVFEQQRRRPACASAQSDQCLCCSLIGKYHILTCYKRNFNSPASLCSCAGWFAYDLVRNPADRVSVTRPIYYMLPYIRFINCKLVGASNGQGLLSRICHVLFSHRCHKGRFICHGCSYNSLKIQESIEKKSLQETSYAFFCMFFYQMTSSLGVIYTYYHNSNLIWRTVSCLLDEVIPSDHPRREAPRVIQWYDLIQEK